MHPEADNPAESPEVEAGTRAVTRRLPGAGAGRPGAEWVTVGEFANGVDADLARTLLEGRDIPVVLENREFVGMDWAVAAAVGWIKVQVPPDRAHEAVSVLRKASESRGPDVQWGEGGVLHDAETCLSCGGVMPVGDSMCDACGWTFTEELEAGAAVERGEVSGRLLESPEPEERFERGAAVLMRALWVGVACVVIIVLVMAIAQHGFNGGWW